jgi:hypothetical protein
VLIQAVVEISSGATAAGLTATLLALGLLQHILYIDKLRPAALATCQANMSHRFRLRT